MTAVDDARYIVKWFEGVKVGEVGGENANPLLTILREVVAELDRREEEVANGDPA